MLTNTEKCVCYFVSNSWSVVLNKQDENQYCIKLSLSFNYLFNYPWFYLQVVGYCIKTY